MSRNIKEIGKELMGKSLNSFHRKTGLTQLEENNKMQDGILDGILSQVDDAYIEKTEQSNVIHLDGSGDGVVVLDSIEGNTMVNLWDFNKVEVTGQVTKTNNTIKITTTDNRWSNFFMSDKGKFKPSTDYTFVIDVKKNTLTDNSCITITSNAGGTNRDVFEGYNIRAGKTGIFKKKLTTISDFSQARYGVRSFFDNIAQTLNCEVELNIIILEGDWTNKEIPASYFTGLQSSFEEKVNDEGKYEIEILMKNKNLLNFDNVVMDKLITEYKVDKNTNSIVYKKASTNGNNGFVGVWVNVKPNTSYTLTHNKINGGNVWIYTDKFFGNHIVQGGVNPTFNSGNNSKLLIGFYTHTDGNVVNEYRNVLLRESNTNSNFMLPKQNKIKLLLDEPLRKVNNNYKDRLCIKDGRLVVERKCGIDKNLHLRNWTMYTLKDEYPDVAGFYANVLDMEVHGGALVCDKFKCMERDMHPGNVTSNEEFLSGTGGVTPYFKFNIKRDKLSTLSVDGFKTYLQQNPVTVVYPLLTPIYEEVLNEYGEPILLEGYENGTIFIDSTIVPTTTLRYTPKMESLKTLKAVNDNNIMLTDDINNNIIDYMMNVDMMIMEKEMQNTKTRRIGEKDMTNMQKRTFEMLKRLIKGKTLTEQECKDRVVLYLSANKITSEQAEELMVYISEIYN